MIQKAIRFAIEAHKDQQRKGTEYPYIEHPMHVGMLLSSINAREEVVVAGILHDTLEDTKTTKETLKSEFNETVLHLVESSSEPDKSLFWIDRKKHSIEYLKNASTDSRLICLCDKLSNLMAIEADFNQIGDEIWYRFNAGYEEQKWYYESLGDALSSLNNIGLYKDYTETVKRVFK